MSVKLNTGIVSDVAVMRVSGEMTEAEGSAIFRNRIRLLLDQGHKNILADLSGVNNVNGSGIGAAVSAFVTVTREGGQFKLLNPGPRFVLLLQITELITVFDIYKDEAAAIASFTNSVGYFRISPSSPDSGWDEWPCE